MDNRSEHAIQNDIRAYCGSVGWLCFRCNVGRVLCADGTYWSSGLPDGFSDLLAIGPEGRVVFIEVKTATGKQRESQRKFEETIKYMGHIYIVARNVGDVAEIIK